MKSKKSAVELEIKEMTKRSNEIIDDSYLTTKEGREIVDLLGKAADKVEELRKSRDLASEKREYWKERYYTLKNGNKKTKTTK